MKSLILGGSYTRSELFAAVNRMVNLYPEAVPEGGKERGFLTRCPGLRVLASVAGGGPVRGLHAFGGQGYAVIGSSLYRVSPSWSLTLLGAVSSGSGPVSMADNGTQLFVACNPKGFIYNASTGLLSEITDPDFPGAVTVGYLDGYFVFNQPDSQMLWVTSLLDGTAIDPLEFASAEGAPDELVALIVDHREVWLFGENSVEVWYDSGAVDFPLERIQGVFLETGCSAAASVAKMDNSLFWLGRDSRGFGMVFRANGHSEALRVSNHAIEEAIASYGDTSDALAYSYSDTGHSFYVLIFPTAGTCWVFDAATNEWHERAGFSGGSFTRYPANCHMVLGNTHVIGDYQAGVLYAYDSAVYTSKWLRSWRALPPGSNDYRLRPHRSLQLVCVAGVGLVAGQGSDPQVMLRWSDDDGRSWSNEHWASMGAMGDRLVRVMWNRLGASRDRVYEVSGTDPVLVSIMGAELGI